MNQQMNDLKEKLAETNGKLDPAVSAFIDKIIEDADIEKLKTMTDCMSIILNSATEKRQLALVTTNVALVAIAITFIVSPSYGMAVALANIMGDIVANLVLSHSKFKALDTLDSIGFPVREFMHDISSH